jgi:tetraacyldisaccharide 4'-kinase
MTKIIKHTISIIYFVITQIRNILFDIGVLKSFRTKTKVISVGNIIVGGAGKTPLTKFIVNELIGLGFRIAIVGRGYGRKSTENIILFQIDKEKNKTIKADEHGDEMIELYLTTKADIFIGNKKYIMALEADELELYDYIIIDDGFQHRKIQRDKNIVIIDDNTLSNNSLLPLGRLREPYSSLKRADAIVMRKTIDNDKSGFIDNILYAKYQNNLKSIKSLNIPNFDLNYLMGDVRNYNLKKFYINDISNKSLNIITAIANPNVLISSLGSLKLKIINKFIFKDHYNFTENDILEILNKSNIDDIFLTTEKDYVKIKSILDLLSKQSKYKDINEVMYKVIADLNLTVDWWHKRCKK